MNKQTREIVGGAATRRGAGLRVLVITAISAAGIGMAADPFARGPVHFPVDRERQHREHAYCERR